MVFGAAKMKGVNLVNLDIRGDKRGSLIALEGLSKQVPFDIKRVYYIFGTKPNVVRGKHAHYKLKQLLICVSGSVDILLDDGKNKDIVRLDRPDKGLYIEGLIYHEMKNFYQGAVLLVLASDHYNEEDYIRGYEVFKREVLK